MGLAIRDANCTPVTSSVGNADTSFEDGEQRAVREARRIAKIDIVESVVKVYNVIEENNTAYIIKEYIAGKTITEIVKKSGTFSAASVCECLLPIMRALLELHSRNIVHRDISPDNIILRKGTSDESMLLDFSAAKDLGTERVTDSLRHGYAPLEQYSNVTVRIGSHG